ncbi:MAG TPA: hypothetical protein PKA63_03205 [Oligoflexia bacterium]|nr:hypothetical protein [Oligoflexia bacterium]HMP47663.1 hypothetical protein [Oligoflexia bacterium]
MPRLLRKFAKGEVYFVTNRVAEGLPFVPNALINTFLNGILARSLSLHPEIDLCGYVFMGNHYHLVIVLNGGGEVLKSFMEYLDGEIGKFINRFRGKSNQNVWAKTYDAQVILTPEAVMQKLKYMYLNPVSAGLIDSIEKYPGLSSWKSMIKDKERSYRFLGSAGLSKLPYGPLPKKTMCSIIRDKFKSSKFTDKNFLRIKPFAWVKCFSSFKDTDPLLLKEELISDIKEEEIRIRRKKSERPTPGAQALISQCFHKRFKSKKYQKRSPCISTCMLLREEYLEEYRDFVQRCKIAYLKYKENFTQVNWPPGAFPPTKVPMASLIQINA